MLPQNGNMVPQNGNMLPHNGNMLSQSGNPLQQNNFSLNENFSVKSSAARRLDCCTLTLQTFFETDIRV